jgi:hypothetical protein
MAGTESITLRNPALAGEVAFDTVIYASSGLTYPVTLFQYAIYSSPDPAYVTGRLNISAFANLGSGAAWPFTNTTVPLNGHVCVPRGRGPFPLVVFVHGNHSPIENSTPGYLYLCQLLASHGIIAATIDALRELSRRIGDTTDDAQRASLREMHIQLTQRLDELVALRLRDVLESESVRSALAMLKAITAELVAGAQEMKTATDTLATAAKMIDRATKAIGFLGAIFA